VTRRQDIRDLVKTLLDDGDPVAALRALPQLKALIAEREMELWGQVRGIGGVRHIAALLGVGKDTVARRLRHLPP